MKKNTVVIGKPVSPSTILSAEEIKVEQIVLSYGGGMGGTTRTLYAVSRTKVEDNFYALTLIDGKELEVGISFVVSKEPKKIVKLHTDKTLHSNYHKIVCRKSEMLEYILLEVDESFIISDDYRKGEKLTIVKKESFSE